MQKNNHQVASVILAAGKGTRLNCTEIPKVMLKLNGKPMVEHTVENLEEAGFSSQEIIMVVGFQKEKVKEYFGDRVKYANQKEQLGTAHAAFKGMKQLSDDIDDVLVLGGDDSAFYKTETLRAFVDRHTKNNSVLTLLSTKLENPDQYGRIIRHNSGDVEIIEKEYLTEKQEKIKEISTGTFCFDKEWFLETFPDMPKMKKLGEYGLPTALAMARQQGVEYQVVELEDEQEWIGVNTPEDLKQARKMMNKRKDN
ncbi:MAG: sugar phosphate nucleotidyltransferase [Candidatus Magasanikbacteria bacterium]